MAGSSAEHRRGLDERQFAFVDLEGRGYLPLNSEADVRDAISRWNHSYFESPAERERARHNIVSAAQKFGIELTAGDRIMQRPD